VKQSFRVTLGLWLERFPFLRPVLMEFSHEYPDGTRHYINRVSRTFIRTAR
jgi:hypothetical protein